MIQHVISHTKETVLAYVVVEVSQVTPWLEISSVGVKVVMGHSLFDADAEAQSFTSEGMDGVHELCIIRRQSVCRRNALKQWPCWVKTWREVQFIWFLKTYLLRFLGLIGCVAICAECGFEIFPLKKARTTTYFALNLQTQVRLNAKKSPYRFVCDCVPSTDY